MQSVSARRGKHIDVVRNAASMNNRNETNRRIAVQAKPRRTPRSPSTTAHLSLALSHSWQAHEIRMRHSKTFSTAWYVHQGKTKRGRSGPTNRLYWYARASEPRDGRTTLCLRFPHETYLASTRSRTGVEFGLLGMEAIR